MNAETADQDPGRAPARERVAAAKDRCRAPATVARARRRSAPSTSAACRTAGSRSGNTPTCAPLMREAEPLAGPPDAAAKARAPRRRLRGALDRRRSSSSALSCRSCPISAGLAGRRRAVRSRGAGRGRSRWTHPRRQACRRDDVAVALNTAFMGDGAVIHVAPGAAVARPLHLVFVAAGRPSRLGDLHALARRGREGRARHAGREPRGRGGASYQVNAALELEVGDDAHVDHVKITARARALHMSDPDGGDRRACPLQHLRVHHRRRVVRNQLFVALRRRGHGRRHPRREPAQGPPARRHHAGRRPRGAALPEPRGVQVGARRRGAAACSRARSSCGRARRRPTPR